MKFIIYFLLTVALVACDSQQNSDEAEQKSQEQMKTTVLEPTLSTLQKAKGVEDIIQNQDQELRQNIDEQSGE